MWEGCPSELKLTRAMRHGAVDVMLCDALDFSSRFVDYMEDVPALFVMVVLKELTSLATWIST